MESVLISACAWYLAAAGANFVAFSVGMMLGVIVEAKRCHRKPRR